MYKRKTKEKIYKYEDIRDSLQSFDIINCTPWHWFFRFVKHTAVVYRCRETGQLLVSESTQLGTMDDLKGVQLRPLREWVKNYPGEVRIRSVRFLPPVVQAIDRDDGQYVVKRETAEADFAICIRKYRGTAYPPLNKLSGLWMLLNAKIDLPWKSRLRNKDTDKVIFCTLWVFLLFRFCMLMKPYTNPAEAEPDDTVPGKDKMMRDAIGSRVLVGPERRVK